MSDFCRRAERVRQETRETRGSWSQIIPCPREWKQGWFKGTSFIHQKSLVWVDSIISFSGSKFDKFSNIRMIFSDIDWLCQSSILAKTDHPPTQTHPRHQIFSTAISHRNLPKSLPVNSENIFTALDLNPNHFISSGWSKISIKKSRHIPFQFIN